MANSNKRKPLSKKIRFEVFKRDAFRCQHCGKTRDSHPELILHVDHLVPVAKGGENDLLNLVTACNTCNQGKSDTPLDDNTYLNKSRKQADILHERLEQLKMQMEWVKELRNTKQETIDSLCKYWNEYGVGFFISDNGKKTISQLYRKYSYEEITNAMDIAAEQYLVYKKDGDVTSGSWNTAFDKIKGVCRVEKESKDDPDLKRLYYIRGIARNRCGYFSEWQALDHLKAARSWNISLNYLSDIAKRITSWTQFIDEISNAIDEVKKTEEGADDENTFIITLSKDDAELLKEQAGFVEMTPEEIVKNSVLNNIQPTTERLKKYWLDFYINPHDKEDFRFNISDWREEHSQYGYEYSHEMEKVKHFWGEYNSLDFIAADILMFANEIYAHSYLGEIEKFGGHEDIDRFATYLQNYWEKNDSWDGICFISKEPHA